MKDLPQPRYTPVLEVAAIADAEGWHLCPPFVIWTVPKTWIPMCQQGSHQVRVKLLLFTYNEINENYKPINLFYNKYLSVRILFTFWLSEVKKTKDLHSNYEDQQRAKIAYEGKPR